MADESIAPALTPEEWAQQGAGEYGDEVSRVHWDGEWRLQFSNGDRDNADTTRLHAAAALALYGQPFGFTAKDVEWLRWLATYDYNDPDWHTTLDVEQARSLAARIAALLPPAP
jgi:hypothetical protein